MRGPHGQELPGAVLFACTQNAVRSPMAAAIMRHLFGKFVFVDSAGVTLEDRLGHRRAHGVAAAGEEDGARQLGVFARQFITPSNAARRSG